MQVGSGESDKVLQQFGADLIIFFLIVGIVGEYSIRQGIMRQLNQS